MQGYNLQFIDLSYKKIKKRHASKKRSVPLCILSYFYDVVFIVFFIRDYLIIFFPFFFEMQMPGLEGVSTRCPERLQYLSSLDSFDRVVLQMAVSSPLVQAKRMALPSAKICCVLSFTIVLGSHARQAARVEPVYLQKPIPQLLL